MHIPRSRPYPIWILAEIVLTLLRCLLKSICAGLTAAYKARNSVWDLARMRAARLFSSNMSVCCRTASKPNKPTQKTLDTLFVKGSTKLIDQAKRLGEEQLSYAHPVVSFKAVTVTVIYYAVSIKENVLFLIVFCLCVFFSFFKPCSLVKFQDVQMNLRACCRCRHPELCS